MNTKSINKLEKKIFHRWFCGYLIKDEQGNFINHRIWFKNILNPFLRLIGCVIVTHVDKTGKIKGYSIRKYKK
jgi:hypothetical protein